MEEYIGVKFKSKLTKKGIRPSCISEITAAGKRLGEEGLIFSNEGNISSRVKNGFVITAAGEPLDKLQREDFALVTGCDLKKRVVMADGKKTPSSESIMHHLIYTTNPNAKAVVHAHAGVFLNEAKIANSDLASTDVFLEYGTLELAYNMVKTLGKDHFIILKGHGAVAIGSSMTEATDLIISKYRQLKGLPVRVSDIPKENQKEAEVEGSEEEESVEFSVPAEESMPDIKTEEADAPRIELNESELEFKEELEPRSEVEEPQLGEVVLELEEGPEPQSVEGVFEAEGEAELPEEKAQLPEGWELCEAPEPEPVKTSIKFPKFRLPSFRTTAVCPQCGTKKKRISRSCPNCGYFFSFDKISPDTINLIKVERKRGD